MEEINERDETVELARAVVRNEARREFEILLGEIAAESGLTKDEAIHSDMETMALAAIVSLIENERFPDAFWVGVYFKAKEGGYLKEVSERFDVKVLISLKKRFLPNADYGEGERAYA